jgi:hypothetical protein
MQRYRDLGAALSPAIVPSLLFLLSGWSNRTSVSGPQSGYRGLVQLKRPADQFQWLFMCARGPIVGGHPERLCPSRPIIDHTIICVKAHNIVPFGHVSSRIWCRVHGSLQHLQ